MKTLLFLFAVIIALPASAQLGFDIGAYKNKLAKLKKQPGDLLKLYQSPTDSMLKQYTSPMPNAITKPLPPPRLLGNNANGHNIYILPLDNMPMIKPDSTFRSNMYTGRRRS